MKKIFFILALLLFLLPCVTKAQGFLYTGIALNQNGRPIPNPTITVCTSSGTGVPCTPTAGVNLFSDAAMTLPVSNPLSNCVTIFQAGCSDAVGNFSFYIAPGEYTYTISGSGTTLSGPFKISIPCVINNGIDSCGGTGTFAYVPDTSSSYISHATPTFQMGGTSGNKSTVFDFVLNQNVTAITFSVSNPPPANTTIFSQLNLCENGTGGWTLPNGAWPINVILPTGFTFVTTAGACNHLMFRYNPQTNTWTTVIDPGSGGGGGVTPAGADGDNQIKSGGNLAAGHISEAVSGNTTVSQTFNTDSDYHGKGPNPYFDIMRYGGYVANSSSLQTMTCSINASSTTLSCVSNPDFANGQGVVIPLAGAGPTDIPTAPTGTVTPIGVINGATTYCYKFVLENYSGALTAAGTPFCTSSGAVGLGNTAVSLTQRSRTNGVDTYTCISNCNIGIGAQVQISGFTGGSTSLSNGTIVVNSIPTTTTFTALATGFLDDFESNSATVAIQACNELFPSGSLAIESRILRTWVYRQDGGAGNFNLKGVSPGQDPFFIDCNQGVSGQPAYVPSTAPASSQTGYLATTISSGGGTTSMTLATAATTTASSQTVQHDNSSALQAAYIAALAAHGGVVRVPVIPNATNLFFPFNSTLDMSSISNPTNSTVKIEVTNAGLSQPWILDGFSEIEGIPQVSTSFQYSPLGSIGGSAHPLILANNRTAGGVKISKIKFAVTAIGQSSIVLDQKLTGGGEVGFILDDNGYSGNAAPAVTIKGGFDFWFNRGVCGVGGAEANIWFAHPCIELTNASTYLGSTTQVPGRIWLQHMTFSGGTSVQMDNIPLSNQSGTSTTGPGGNIFFESTLHESYAGPAFRWYFPNAAFGNGVSFKDVVTADQVNGLRTPLVEMTGTTNVIQANLVSSQGVISQPAISGGGTRLGATCINNAFLVGCGQSPYYNISGQNTVLDAGTIGAQNGGSMGYLMPTPAAPASCVVSAGGSVPVGATFYSIVATDRTPISLSPLTGVTLNGPQCNVTTTGGNQTVTITRPALPSGATGWIPWRSTVSTQTGAETNIPACAVPLPVSQTTFVDTFSFTCGTSAPTFPNALVNGVLSDRTKGILANYNGYQTTPTSVKTSAYTLTANDNIIPLDATSGGFTVSINPAIVGSHWVLLRTDNTPVNTVTISPTSGTIDGAASTTIPVLSGIIITCPDGTNCRTEARSSGGGAANINNSLQFSFPYYSAAGSSNTISGVAPPTSNSVWFPIYNVTGSTAVTPSIALLGSPVIALTGNSSLDYTYRAADVRFSSCSTPTLTLPAASGTTASNLIFRVLNGCSGDLTVTSTSPNSINGGSAGGSITVKAGEIAFISQDNTPNWWATVVPTTGAYPTSCTAINYTSSGHIVCASLPVVSNVNSQTVTYTAVAGDNGKIVSMNGSSLTLNLPASPPAQPWGIFVQNLNASSLTVSRNGLNIDGAASNITVPQSQGFWVTTDGSNYFTSRGLSSATAGVSSLTGDGALITNSGSTGAVTLSLGNAAGHKYWGNPTGSSATPAYNSIVSADLPAGIQRRVCTITVGDTSGSAITNAQLGPQKKICFIPAASTVLEVEVTADGGTPNVIVGRNRAGTTTNLLSSALATAASGAIACSNTGGTTGIDGATTCSATLQNTSTNAGDFFELVSGTAGGTAKLFSVNIVYTIN